MRLAVAGKGGAGKTTLSATLARVVAASGQPVVAIDADANPNLSVALGISLQAAADLHPVPPALVSRRPGGTGLLESVENIVDRHAIVGPDGIRLLGMGAPAHADEGCLCSAHAVVSALLEDLGGTDRFVVVDMEASPEHLSRGTVRHVDAIWLVAEPYYRSLETVRRMSQLVAELPIQQVAVVANKIRSQQDATAVGEFCDRHGLALAGTVPWSEAVLDADQRRVPAVDVPEAADVVRAVRELAASAGAL
ncbi:MAG: AAA family ATPase [Actinomycetota bacterium]|nr:AAA family ATPase [Actinomycetota bacterium]